ncbi:hypothetical protein DPMN_006997 [Dreissena polymorpha]|uniref:EGF-like domain-containing protein n=1 Tax=Dreissena polymorpha TaxID=45954 RepID=A0A9D4RVW7_DREPO|nr:hypothetical protein DPMN_006995 [Dreissena polymorpha]KAH3883049.1 hypothetical protein DPMN_006997 [Dreissena polymorpha]
MIMYLSDCEEAPCQNDGTCDNQQNGYTCACTQGWTGPICDQGGINLCETRSRKP